MHSTEGMEITGRDIMSTETERVPLSRAAKEIGMSNQGLREYMKRGKIDIGYVLPSLTGKQYNYIIFRDKLDAYLGENNK